MIEIGDRGCRFPRSSISEIVDFRDRHFWVVIFGGHFWGSFLGSFLEGHFRGVILGTRTCVHACAYVRVYILIYSVCVRACVRVHTCACVRDREMSISVIVDFRDRRFREFMNS